MFILSGCGKKSADDILTKTKDKLEKSNSYHLTGVLEMINDETNYKYDVDVSYMKKNNFKVVLKNQVNDHEQIILKNPEGVFVITPSLNKSFKFQSDWPYNNSQAYLLQTILEDLQDDESRKAIESEKNEIIFESSVNYINNKSLKKQKVYISNEGLIKKVEVYDNDNNVKIKMEFKKIEYNTKYKEKYFTLDENITTIKNLESEEKIKDVIYPMYVPENTKLSNQETINLDEGMRVILDFEGDKSFTLIQETVNVIDEFTTTPVDGSPIIMGNIFGNMDENSIRWIDQGIEYYLVSENLNQEELLKVALSVNNATVIK